MAATVTKLILSGSTDGLPIPIDAVATAGNTIHLGSATTTDIDEIWIWAQNADTVARDLTIEWGGVTDPDHIIEVTIEPSGTAGSRSGPELVVPGLIIQGNAVQLTVAGFASVTDQITVHGFVNRISSA